MSRTGDSDRQPLGSTADVADYLKIPEKTLVQWRYLGQGPNYRRVGRHVRYRWVDVDRWLDEQNGKQAS